MNKKIKGLIGAAVLVMALPLHGFAAADAVADLQAGTDGAEVSIVLLKSGTGQGVNALQMSFSVEAVAGSLDKAQVTFDFAEDLAGTVKRSSFNRDTNLLTVYVAGADGKLFENDRADLGSIQVEAAEGEYLELSITAGKPGETTETVKGLTLLTGNSSARDLTVQAANVTVNVGTVAPDPGPGETPEATQKPETSPQPETTPQPTEQPQVSEKPQATQAPVGGSNGSQNKPAQNTATGSPATQPTAQPEKGSGNKTPDASSTAQSSESSSVASESQAASSEVQSETASSESQVQSTQAQTNGRKSNVLPVAIGLTAAVVVIVAGVVIYRRGRQ